MAERMKTDADFFRDVNEYVRAETAAKGFIGKIEVAETEVRSAVHGLNSALFKQKLDQAEGEQAAAAAALEQKKAEIKEAQEIFKEVFAIATKIVKQDWKGIAEKALEFVGKKAVDAAYADDLAALKDGLAAAKGKVSHFKTSVLAQDIEKARADLAAAAGRLDNVHEEFEAALDELGNQQANAQNELNESKQTAPVGQMIGERVKQIAAISDAKAACAIYTRAADGAKSKLEKIAGEFAKVGTWLDLAAKADSAFDREMPYAKMIERCSRRNADLFWNWAATVPSAKRECDEALRWLADSGDKGPMGDFEKARKATSKGLKKAA
jgi:chromosome segregation ATPase